MSANSKLKATKIISQRKAFYRQRIPGWARRETVDIEILVTSSNGDRKIMQSIRITKHGMVSTTKVCRSDQNIFFADC